MGACWTGSTSRIRCSSSSGRTYLVIPGEADGALRVGCVVIELVGDVVLLRMLAVAPNAAARAWLRAGRGGDGARGPAGVRQLHLVTDGAQG